ncbi:MAG: TfoX/Sxy family protein [Cellvibrio sp.]
MNHSQSDLLQLKNLGIATVNILRAVGIHTQEDLARVGAVDTYNRIRARKINVSKVMLYALHGALHDIHWNDLKPQLKQELVALADQSSAVESQVLA